MDPPKIVDFEKLVEPHLNGSKLISYTSRYLTKPGDNYGSIILSITANLKHRNGIIEELPLVAKLPPITNDFYWQIFQPERTCLTENAVYKYLGPGIRQIQLDAGIPEEQLFDGLAQYYGSRVSLDEQTEKVDRDAVLVQENLQTSGFKAPNRHKMYDYDHAKLVLEYFAKFHALPIAYRQKKPEEFNKYVRPYFKRLNMNDGLTPEMEEEITVDTLKEVEAATNNNENTVARVKELKEIYDQFCSQPDKSDDLFVTISHCDAWINNLMIQYDAEGAPKKLKIVDFQLAQYDSVAHDIIFMLFSSVDTQVLEDHFDEFLRFYYETFIDCLKSVNVSTEQYSYEKFLNEIHMSGPVEMYHALIMTKIVMADNSTFPDDFKDMDLSVISKNTGRIEITQKTQDILRLGQKFKLI